MAQKGRAIVRSEQDSSERALVMFGHSRMQERNDARERCRSLF